MQSQRPKLKLLSIAYSSKEAGRVINGARYAAREQLAFEGKEKKLKFGQFLSENIENKAECKYAEHNAVSR